jgi:hypothetical protein
MIHYKCLTRFLGLAGPTIMFSPLQLEKMDRKECGLQLFQTVSWEFSL